MVLYSRADTWLGWGEAREVDRPLKSLGRILRLSMHGLNITLRGLMTTKKKAPKGRLAASVAPLLLFACFSAGSLFRASAQTQGCARPGAANTVPGSAVPQYLRQRARIRESTARPVAPGNFDNIFTLADMGVPDTIVLRGVDAYHSIQFSVPQTQVIKTATMHIRYHFSPGLHPGYQPPEDQPERHAVRHVARANAPCLWQPWRRPYP